MTVAALSVGDALLVALVGGTGTVVGGTLTAVIAWKTKVKELDEAASRARAEARRRRAERFAQAAHDAARAVGDLLPLVERCHASRPNVDSLPLDTVRAKTTAKVFSARSSIQRLPAEDALSELMDNLDTAITQLLSSRERDQYEALRRDVIAAFGTLSQALAVVTRKHDAASA